MYQLQNSPFERYQGLRGEHGIGLERKDAGSIEAEEEGHDDAKTADWKETPI